MMSNNISLHKAASNKNDEFYTRYEDVEKEMSNYKDELQGKIIYMPCDDPTFSNIWKYFENEFDTFQLKKIVCTHLERDKNSYALIYNGKEYIREELLFDGDFRSPEVEKYWLDADVIVTNPPFSLSQEFIKKNLTYNKYFIIIDNYVTLISQKGIFEKFIKYEFNIGYSKINYFVNEENNIVTFNNVCWFQNIKKHLMNPIKLNKKYDINKYKRYDNFDAINVNRCKDIPINYEGNIGVPISIIFGWDPDEFEFIKFARGDDNKFFQIDNKTKFLRCIIKLKHPYSGEEDGDREEE